MEHTFWHNKWEQKQIGFHLPDIHPLLVRNLPLLELQPGQQVFVPLCGKTLDIGYLLKQGLQVVGVELSETAVQELFVELQLEPQISDWPLKEEGTGKLYQAENIRVFVGDYFELSAADLGKIAAVYDRAALIALPEVMRQDYAKHMGKITGYAPQLLITLEYDQAVMSGPPFSVTAAEVEGLYGGTYPIQKIAASDIIEHEPHFASKGLNSMLQAVYRLK